MAEFKVHHHRRDSDSESIVSCRSIDLIPPTLNRDKNRPVGSRHDATLINPGPPAIYRLNTERTYIDGTDKKVRRWTYGRRDRNKQNKVILLVGETGAGKTTLINTMINYLLGVRFEDEDFYQITEEEEHKYQSQSQTSDITVYEVFVEENPTSLTIIDTPGYTDTKGFKRERKISEYLGRLFSDKDGIHYIDAVCFVMKASQNRLSGKEDYIFHLVLSLFGRDIEDNIVFIITHSDGGAPTDALNAINTAKIQCRKDERKKPVHFLFNNQQKEKREHTYKTSWKMGKKSMKRFLELISENNRKSLEMTLDDLKERKQLEACIFNVMDHITEKESKMEELIEILRAIRQNRDKIEKSENFTFTVKRTDKAKVHIEDESALSRNATCCDVCQENCHQFGCWYVASGDLSNCDVMTDNYCTVCTKKCPVRYHKKGDTKYVIRKKHAEMSFDELKQKYEASFHKTKYEDTRMEHEKDMKESENKTKIEEKLNYDLEEIKKQKSILLHKAYMTIMKLSKNPLITDSYFTPQHLNFFIPRVEREGEGEMVKDLENVKEAVQEQKNRLSNRNWLERATDTSLSGLRELGVPGLNSMQAILRK